MTLQGMSFMNYGKANKFYRKILREEVLRDNCYDEECIYVGGLRSNGKKYKEEENDNEI